MTLSVGQKITVALIILALKVIQTIDVITGEIFEKVTIISSKFVATVLAICFLVFLAYSLKTQYIYQVLQSYQTQQSYQAHTDKNVLGAAVGPPTSPLLIRTIEFPLTTAKSILVVDKSTQRTLYEKSSRARLASASTTKLMTALVALDIYDLDETLVVPQICAEIDSSKAYLSQDSQYRVESLLNAMLISSAGDAACTLAQGKIQQDEFIYRMNQKAYQLKMTSSYFTNPIGLDGLNSSHFSTAQDLYKLAVAAMDNNTIRQIVDKKEYTIKSTDESYIGKLESTNRLLFEIPQTVGVKTGTTQEAGQVLIYEYLDEAKDIVIIVMGSEDRFSDARAILGWVAASYEW